MRGLTARHVTHFVMKNMFQTRKSLKQVGRHPIH